MIKRTKSQGMAELISYICDNCVKEMPGSPIMVYFPYSHPADSLDGPSHFCSDKCLIEAQQKLVKKFGNWKSVEYKGEKVRTSAEYRASRTAKTSDPKSRRGSRKSKINKKTPEQKDTESN